MISCRNLACLLLILCLSQCATQTTPTGGPKDEKAPVLLKSTPADNVRNFKGETIELTFDEQVKVIEPSEEIIITPSPGKQIDFKAKQNKITITPENQWQENTTYSISFREAIQDVTEGNAAEVNLAFSTGPDIDSLFIDGQITNGLLETIPEKITVAIYQADTTDIFKSPAKYFTKTDKQGFFKISNLKPGNYFLYAFEDKNKNLKVESTTEKFGFKANAVASGSKSSDTNTISIVKADSRKIKINSTRRSEKTTLVNLNKSVVSYSIANDKNDSIINHFGDTNSEIILFNPSSKADSLKINLIAKDSIGLTLDTVFHIRQSPVKSMEEPFRLNLNDVTYTSETSTFLLKGTFTKPVARIIPDSIFIKIDSINQINFLPKDIDIDNINKRITLQKQIEKRTILKDNTRPELILGKSFLITYANDSSKRESKTIKMLTPEKTATLEIQLKTNQPFFIIELLLLNGKVQQSVRNVKQYIFKNLEPVAYKLRVITDINNNGQWDPGNIFTRTEAEPVIYYKSAEGKFDINTRENSDIGPLILPF